jgi:hypothetical protein
MSAAADNSLAQTLGTVTKEKVEHKCMQPLLKVILSSFSYVVCIEVKLVVQLNAVLA